MNLLEDLPVNPPSAVARSGETVHAEVTPVQCWVIYPFNPIRPVPVGAATVLSIN
jgi:hypothetical protein